MQGLGAVVGRCCGGAPLFHCAPAAGPRFVATRTGLHERCRVDPASGGFAGGAEALLVMGRPWCRGGGWCCVRAPPPPPLGPDPAPWAVPCRGHSGRNGVFFLRRSLWCDGLTVGGSGNGTCRTRRKHSELGKAPFVGTQRVAWAANGRQQVAGCKHEAAPVGNCKGSA